MLTKKTNPKTGKQEWCLVSKTNGRVLEWYGTKKPSEGEVAKSEARVEFYKTQGK